METFDSAQLAEEAYAAVWNTQPRHAYGPIDPLVALSSAAQILRETPLAPDAEAYEEALALTAVRLLGAQAVSVHFGCGEPSFRFSSRGTRYHIQRQEENGFAPVRAVRGV